VQVIYHRFGKTPLEKKPLGIKALRTLVARYFCKGYDYGEKADLSKTYWILKRKMWITTHFQRQISNHNAKKALKYKECMAFVFQI